MIGPITTNERGQAKRMNNSSPRARLTLELLQ
nr:MAG TPA: hypothetical protein [Bacteriophage sp.]